MSWRLQRRWQLLSGALSVTMLLSLVATPSLARQRSAASPSNTLVVAMFFDGKSLDPGREFENMGNAADRAMYDTLVTFANGVLTKSVPDAATSWTVSGGGKVYTFTLRQGMRFASGNPLTSADVVFSLTREQNIKGNPSFLLANVASITAPTTSTVKITLKQPDPAILSILTNPSLSIVDSKTVIANGGTDAADADKTDKAEAYLNAHSAGTGPYQLTSFSPGNSIAMTANPNYWGPAPKVKNLLFLNQPAATAKLTLQKGDTDIALDLSTTQYQSLKSNAQLTTSTQLSPNIFFLLLNATPAIGQAVANNDVRQAVRYALDYAGIAALAGQGSIQPAGIIPVQLLGALPLSQAPKQDVARAKSLMAKAGYANGFTATMEYPSDISINGQDFGLFAQKIQSDLAAVGITIKLKPAPVAVSLPNYRAGKEQIGFWEWGPDYFDPSDYLLFLPGQKVGLRAGWPAGADAPLAALMTQAETTVDNTKRAAVYRAIQVRLNAVGPFVNLFQPVQVVATKHTVSGFHYNAIWSGDFNLVAK